MTGVACATERDLLSTGFPDVSLLGCDYNDCLKGGIEACQKSEWETAIANLSQAIRLNPGDPRAYEYRAGVYFAKGDFNPAIRDFTRVIELSPTNSQAYFNRGGVYRANEEIDNAIRDFTESLRLCPTNHLTFKCRAACYAAKGDIAKEISDWTQGLKLNPRDPTALAMRGWAHFMAGQFHQAISDYRAAITLESTNALPHNYLAWLYATCPSADMRNGKKAIEHARKACDITSWTRWENIDTLAAAFAEAGDYANAVKHQKMALEKEGLRASDRVEMEIRLKLYEAQRPFHNGQK